jgi:hypothetical protein
VTLHVCSPLIRGADESAMARFLGATIGARCRLQTILIPARRENPGPSKMCLGS